MAKFFAVILNSTYEERANEKAVDGLIERLTEGWEIHNVASTSTAIVYLLKKQ